MIEGSVWKCSRCNRTWHKATMYARTKSESCPGRPPVENSPRTKASGLGSKKAH